jgi:hypothetical protein
MLNSNSSFKLKVKYAVLLRWFVYFYVYWAVSAGMLALVFLGLMLYSPELVNVQSLQLAFFGANGAAVLLILLNAPPVRNALSGIRRVEAD